MRMSHSPLRGLSSCPTYSDRISRALNKGVFDCSCDRAFETYARASSFLVLGHSGPHFNNVRDAFEGVDFFEKTVALFSVEKSHTPAAVAHDAMGSLYYDLTARGANIIGRTCPSGIVSPLSKALVKGRYCGLALIEGEDEVNAYKIRAWAKRLRHEFRWADSNALTNICS